MKLTSDSVRAVVDRMRLPPGMRIIVNAGQDGSCPIVMIALLKTQNARTESNGYTVSADIELQCARALWNPLLGDKDLLFYVAHEVRQLVREVFLHEVDEWLLLDGKHVVDPHPTGSST